MDDYEEDKIDYTYVLNKLNWYQTGFLYTTRWCGHYFAIIDHDIKRGAERHGEFLEINDYGSMDRKFYLHGEEIKKSWFKESEKVLFQIEHPDFRFLTPENLAEWRRYLMSKER